MNKFPKYLLFMKPGCEGIITKEEYEKLIGNNNAFNFSAIKIQKEKIGEKEKLWIKIKRVLPRRTCFRSVKTFSKKKIRKILLEEKKFFTVKKSLLS